jgi:RsmE family RNA methyltransferase
VLLAIGPEGGWNDFERGLLEGHGFTPVGLGSRTLRTDTACIALLALVHEALRASGSGPGAGVSEG